MSIRVLIAPSGFKESLDAPEVAAAVAEGVLRALPTAAVTLAPIADGGEGFTRALVAATGGTVHPAIVTGPVGDPVAAGFGMLGGTDRPTAVIEMASAAGLRLVPSDLRNPQATTTHGVGELIRHAIDAGAERIIIGCGDSGTNDGGMGMAAALGAQFLDADGNDLPARGDSLSQIAAVDLDGFDQRVLHTQIEVACNPRNVLCGEHGVARVFGPQKGASPETVEALAAGLDHYADVIEAATGSDIRTAPGGGASGGLGAGLAAWCGARLLARWDVITRYLDLDDLLDSADLVITAEGSLDKQTPNGKIPAEIARRARHRAVPVIALAGTLGDGASDTLRAGIGAFTGVLQRPCTLGEAINDAAGLVADAAEQVMRMLLIGDELFDRQPQPAMD
jgi:glycerate 2-kinase